MAIKKLPDGRIDRRDKSLYNCNCCGIKVNSVFLLPLYYKTYNKGLCINCAVDIDDSMRCISCHYPITEYEIEEYNQHCSSCMAERADALAELREDR